MIDEIDSYHIANDKYNIKYIQQAHSPIMMSFLQLLQNDVYVVCI